MARFGDTIRCDGCGVEIPLSPVKVDDHDYCCVDCSQGLTCKCGEEVEMEESREQTANVRGLLEF